MPPSQESFRTTSLKSRGRSAVWVLLINDSGHAAPKNGGVPSQRVKGLERVPADA